MLARQRLFAAFALSYLVKPQKTTLSCLRSAEQKEKTPTLLLTVISGYVATSATMPAAAPATPSMAALDAMFLCF